MNIFPSLCYNHFSTSVPNGLKMRTLSADMLQAQEWQPLWNPSTGLGRPLARIRIRNNRGSVRLYEWLRWYNGAETTGPQATAIPADGSLNRFRIDPGTKKIYRQRIAVPADDSDYTNWVDTGDTGLAIAACANGTHVAYFFIDSVGGEDIRWAESDNSGVDWDADADTGLNGDTYGCLACCETNAGTIGLIYSRAHRIYGAMYIPDAWGAEGDSALTFTNLTGLAVYRPPVGDGDWNIVLTAEDNDNCWGVYQTIWGRGYSIAENDWDSVRVILQRLATEDYEYYAPSITLVDTHRINFTEKYTAATVRSLVFWSHNPPSMEFINCLWLEPVPFNYLDVYGLSIAFNGVNIFLCGADAVFFADSTLVTNDVTTDLVEYKQTIDPEGTKSKLKVVLDNTAGTYDAFAKLGWEITLELGYTTLSGNEYSSTPPFWITGWRKVSPPWFPLRAFYPTGVCGTIEIDAESMWEVLNRWRSRRVIEWVAGDANVLHLMTWVLARVGLELYNASGDAELANYEPNLKINRGYNGRWAIQYLLKLMKCKAIQRGTDFRLVSCAVDEASDYEYDSHYGAATILYRGHYGTGFQDPNYVQVIGDAVMEEDLAFADIIPGYDRYTAITKPEYDAVARAAYRAEREIRQGQIKGAYYGWLQTPINAVLEPYDVVTITDDAGGVSSIIRRVLKIETTYAARQYAYRQKCTLGHR